MAKPERLPGGFELANGRAADRVSEKEEEAGRSRRQSWTVSAAASPWQDPGLRLQRLHKEAFLGAAVSLLVRGRRQAGARALRGAPRPPPGLVPTGGVAPAEVAGSRCTPRAAPAGTLRRARPVVRISPPVPPTGAGLLLLPLTGGPFLTWSPAGLCSLRASPFSLWAETGPLLPAGGWSSLLSADGDWPRALLPAGGRRPVRLALPEGLGPAVICRLLVGSAVPGDRLRAALPRWVGSPVQRASRGSRPAPCTTRRRTRSNSDTKSQRPLLRPGGFSLCRRGTRCLAPLSPCSLRSFLLKILLVFSGVYSAGNALLLGDSCPGSAPNIPPAPCAGSGPLGPT